MAVNNEYVNRVDANGQTLIDLTSDTATAGDVLEGRTLHLASGAPAVGTYRPSDEIEARLRATVGHSSKNLLKITADTRTINGITYTVDKQAGTVTANGTASNYADFALVSHSSFYQERGMILSGCTGGSSETYWIDTWDDSVQIRNFSGETSIYTQSWTTVRIVIRKGVSVSNLVFKPMIRDGSIADDTFEPYQEPTDRLIETKTRAYLNSAARAYLNSTVGHACKNLLKITADTKTTHGVTFTADKTAGTITASGTATSDAQLDFQGSSPKSVSTIKNGLIYSCKGTSSNLVCAISYYNSSGTYISEQRATTSGTIISIPSNANSYKFWVRKKPAAGSDTFVFKPMIRDGSIADDTFEPYQEPTDSLIETKARAYLTSTVGHTCKNYISYDTSTYTYTANGITFTLDPSAGTVTANGTATANTEFRIPFNHITTISGNVVYTKKPIKSGKYYFCGSPSGGTSTSYWCFVYDNTTGSGAKKWDGTHNVSRDYGDVHKNEVLIDDTHSQRFTILIANGYTASNVVFRPMIWSGDIDDDTFEPYVMPTDEKKQDKPVVLWEGDVTTNLTVNIGDNSYYSHYILTGISSVKIDRSAYMEAPAIFTVIIYSDMPGNYYVPDYDIYAILTISYQSSQGVTNMVIDNPKNITLNKIIGIPK